ncbi:hypothetical protein VNO78_19813 [Psophocarpus tetragonolobus]|uniref:Uncharacterized protein n=1 Tax=Psophocarpus tetragonolobus TaxID=3891 RepID=A0AAN9S8S0_PSOTE
MKFCRKGALLIIFYLARIFLCLFLHLLKAIKIQLVSVYMASILQYVDCKSLKLAYTPESSALPLFQIIS